MNLPSVKQGVLSCSLFLLLIIQACTQTQTSNLVLVQDDRRLPLQVIWQGNAKSFLANSLPSKNGPSGQSVENQQSHLNALIQNFKTNHDTAAKGNRYGLITALQAETNTYLTIKILTNAPVLVCELFENNKSRASDTHFLYPPTESIAGTAINFAIPLVGIENLGGFQLSVLEQNTSFTILGLEIRQGNPGLSRQAEVTTMPADFRILEDNESIQMDVESSNLSPGALSWIDVIYDNTITTNQAQAVELFTYNKGQDPLPKKWLLRIRPGIQHIPIYQALLGYDPKRLLITKKPSTLKIVGFEYHQATTKGLIDYQIPNNGFVAPNPLPADIWTILHFPQPQWRQAFLETFSWNLFPDIIIIDFANLEIQDRFVKRIVYFVEKKHYRGKLYSNSTIAPLHGWNANDFSAESLAAFYSLAAKTNFHLNAEEVLLRECLVQWKLIAHQGSLWIPLKGGLLSVARGPQMTELNRTLLLQHECQHGIYFARSDFRKSSEDAYHTMSPSAKSFMKDYLSFYQYDPEDHELMVNETQAYLLQQPIGALTSYLTFNMVKNYARIYPNREAAFRKLAMSNSAAIIKTAHALSEELFRQTGLINGELACLEALP